MSDHSEINSRMTMEELLNQSMGEVVPNKVIIARVVTLDKNYVYINVGCKSDGRIPIAEFSEKLPVTGDELEVVMSGKGLTDGLFSFSHTLAVRMHSWEKFVTSFENGQKVITGKFRDFSGKGYIFDCNGVTGFVPFSLAGDIRIKKDSKDKPEFLFKIVNIDKSKKNILLSRKEILEEETKALWQKIISQYKAGDVIEGKVTKFVDYGAFIDIGGFEALLYKDDLSWSRSYKKNDILKVGATDKFKILSIDEAAHKISLGLKQLKADPWLSVKAKYPEGTTCNGIVSHLTEVGTFVELEEGIEGFVRNDNLSWTNKNIKARDLFQKDQQIQVIVTGINSEERKLDLGFKQLTVNPWDTIDQRFPVKSVHKAPVKKITTFGMFVNLEDGIDGLIHISDISWEKQDADVLKNYKSGDVVEFKILEIDKSGNRISCGMKQLVKSPWDKIKEKYQPRTKVSGTVSEINNAGLVVKIVENVEGFVPISEAVRQKVETLNGLFKVGDEVQAIVLDVDVKKHKMSLSIKRFDMIEEKAELEKIMSGNSPKTMTIGDMIKLK